MRKRTFLIDFIFMQPHVSTFAVKISIRNNDYFRFMIPTKTRLINLKTGPIIVASIGQGSESS